MNIEELKRDLDHLKKQREEAIAAANACAGAIQYVEAKIRSLAEKQLAAVEVDLAEVDK